MRDGLIISIVCIIMVKIQGFKIFRDKTIETAKNVERKKQGTSRPYNLLRTATELLFHFQQDQRYRSHLQPRHSISILHD